MPLLRAKEDHELLMTRRVAEPPRNSLLRAAVLLT